MSQSISSTASKNARKTLRAWSHKRTPLYIKHLSKFGEVRQCSVYHWQVRGDGLLLNWWPGKGKWKFPERDTTVGEFKEMLREIETYVAEYKAAVEAAKALPDA